MMVHIVSVRELRTRFEHQLAKLAARFERVGHLRGAHDFLERVVCPAKLDFLGEETIPGRREVFTVVHTERDHLPPDFVEQAILLKEDDLRAAAAIKVVVYRQQPMSCRATRSGSACEGYRGCVGR